MPLFEAISLKGFSFQPFHIQLFQEGANNFRQNLNLYGNQPDVEKSPFFASL